MNTTLHEKLQIWSCTNDGIIIFADASLGFVLNLTPVDISCFTDDSVNSYSQRIKEFLNQLPENSQIQFMQDITADNDQLLEKYNSEISNIENTTIKALAKERLEHFYTLNNEGDLPNQKLSLIFRKKIESSVIPKTSIFTYIKNFFKPSNYLFGSIPEDQLNTEIEKVKSTREDILKFLSSLNTSAKSCTDSEIIDLLYQQWNPDRNVPIGYYDPQDIKGHVLYTDVVIDKSGFSLGDYEYKVISLKNLPDQTFASMAEVLQNLPFDSRLHLSINVLDQVKEMDNLKSQRRRAFSMAQSQTSGARDIESEAAHQDVETVIEDMLREGEKVFSFALNVIVKDKDEKVLTDKVSQVLMCLRDLNGSEALVETYPSFDIFSQIAFPNAKATERVFRLKTSNLCHYVPLYGSWPGHNVPEILLRSRYGNLVSFDPFDSSLINSNQIVSGGSGAGKSFLTNLLLLQSLKHNPLVYIIDIGGSYKRLCEQLDGQYIPLKMDSNISINPFDCDVVSDSKKKFLCTLVELMTKEEGDKGLIKFVRSEIESAILNLYEENSNPQLSDLRKTLLKHENSVISQYGSILAPWTGKASYGRMVDQKTNITLDKKIVCFDLQGLENYPDLQSVFLFIIMDFIWERIRENKGCKKFVIFDECWKLLENPEGAGFIAEVFRTFRKHFASAIAISQNIDDFARSQVSGAVLTNSAIKWILSQKGADQARLQEVLSLNDNELSLVGTLTQSRGEYSEAFLMAQDHRSVVKIEPTPSEYKIATTDPRDFIKFEENVTED